MSRLIDLSLLPSLLAFAAFALSTACAKESASAPPPPPPPTVGVTEVALRDVAAFDELPGRVEAVDEVEIRARVAGPILAMRFREGAAVKKGDVLFTIDARPYRAALARARADQARAKARLALANLEASRAQRLITSGAIPKAEGDAIASTATQAIAELSAAAAAVELATLDLEYATVRAPLAGRVGRAMVSVGDFVAPGVAPLTTIVSVDPVRVVFTVDESTYLRYAPRIRAGETVTVLVGIGDEVGFPHEGVIDFVANSLDPATGTIAMRALVVNPQLALTPGLYARVRLAAGSAPSVVIDERAILTDQDRKYVLAVDPKGVAQRKDIALGRLLDGKRVITKGLVTGDRVIVSNVSRVMPGAPVKPEPLAVAPVGGAQ